MRVLHLGNVWSIGLLCYANFVFYWHWHHSDALAVSDVARPQQLLRKLDGASSDRDFLLHFFICSNSHFDVGTCGGPDQGTQKYFVASALAYHSSVIIKTHGGACTDDATNSARAIYKEPPMVSITAHYVVMVAIHYSILINLNQTILINICSLYFLLI